MADVVRIQERLARLPRRPRSPQERPADVLLFTGVRYERLTPAMVAGKGRGPKAAPAGDGARRN
ncbi:hypothetical protein LXM94_21825 [Rhizobium sp. TRM95111]|nr:hypothetical protein [Rhizobium alarense]